MHVDTDMRRLRERQRDALFAAYIVYAPMFTPPVCRCRMPHAITPRHGERLAAADYLILRRR